MGKPFAPTIIGNRTWSTLFFSGPHKNIACVFPVPFYPPLKSVNAQSLGIVIPLFFNVAIWA